MNGKIQETKEEYFLATTALEEFWDTSKPIVFLGDWCKLYGRKSFWETLGAETLENPLENAENLHQAYSYVSGIYEQMIPALANALNQVHGVSHSERYWRIVLGNWLFDYISAVYDKHLSIKLAIKNHPQFTTILLSEKSFVIPQDTKDFISLIVNDHYNLQMHSKLIDLTMENEFPRKNFEQAEDISDRSCPSLFVGIKMFARRAINFAMNGIGLRNKETMLIINNAFFPPAIELRMISRSNGRIRAMCNSSSTMPKVALNPSIREKLREQLRSNDAFTTIVMKMLPFDMPMSFVEKYDFLKRKANKLPKVKFIFSAVGWYFDDIFKIWAAESMEKGSYLIGAQHGGTYGSVNFLFEEEHEIKITDRYYTWGWGNSNQENKVIPFYSTKLIGRQKVGASNKKQGILFTTTCTPRYTFIMRPFLNHLFTDYLCDQYKFISEIDPSLRSELRVRDYPSDYGWDLTKRLKDNFPWLKIESCEGDFVKSMAKCRLFVCDHLSTTFIEALSSNNPTIIFWDPKDHPIREEAQSFYEELNRVGILHYDPKSAAAAVKKVYPDIEKWWNDVERQSVVKRFCERFGRTANNSFDEWFGELNRIINMN